MEEYSMEEEEEEQQQACWHDELVIFLWGSSRKNRKKATQLGWNTFQRLTNYLSTSVYSELSRFVLVLEVIQAALLLQEPPSDASLRQIFPSSCFLQVAVAYLDYPNEIYFSWWNSVKQIIF